MKHLARYILLFALFISCVPYCFAQGSKSSNVAPPSPPAPAIEYNPNSWKEFSSSEGGFKILMPGIPQPSSYDDNTKIGTIKSYMFTLKTEVGEYGVAYADFPIRSDEPSVAKKLIDGGRDELLSKDNKLLNEDDVTLQGNIGRELIVTKGDTITRFSRLKIKHKPLPSTVLRYDTLCHTEFQEHER